VNATSGARLARQQPVEDVGQLVSQAEPAHQRRLAVDVVPQQRHEPGGGVPAAVERGVVVRGVVEVDDDVGFVV
jgi:hypothetical protein